MCPNAVLALIMIPNLQTVKQFRQDLLPLWTQVIVRALNTCAASFVGVAIHNYLSSFP